MAAFLDGVDDMKMAKITEFKDKVELKVVVKPAKKASKPKKKKAAEGVPEPSPEKPPPEAAKPKKKVSTKKPPVEDKEEPKPPAPKKETKETGAKPTKKVSSTKLTGKKTTTGSKKGAKDANEDSGPPLVMGPSSQQRQKDEQSFKVLKWNFSAPRSEFVEQLKDQMSPCVSQSLLTQLFHSDFKQHLTALTTLKECITEPYPFKAEALNSVDLLLKWITLRFCDTNTTVNLKCLELLSALFGLLITERYRMSDYEAASFLPFLVIKSGDAKDAVRKEVRNLFYQICCVYPPPKVFGFVSDGLKTKNSRQRTECLEVLGVMVHENGLAVCQPSPQKAVLQVSTFIGEKDSTVRNAALNTLVVLYGYMGEALYKHVGKIPAKDLSMLEERIRRAAKRSTPPESVPNSTKQQQPQPQQPTSEGSSQPVEEQPSTTRGGKEKAAVDPEPIPLSSSSDTFVKDPSPEPVNPPPQPQSSMRRSRYDGPLKMDWSKYTYPKYKLIDVDSMPSSSLDSLGPEPVVPDLPTSRLLRDPPPSLTFSPKRMASTASAVSYIISQIASSDNTASIAALRQMEEILSKTEHVSIVTVQVDQLVRAILMQLRMNFTTQLQQSSTQEERSEVMHLGKRLTSCLLTVFSKQDYAVAARRDTLIETERDIMNLLLNERMLQLEEVAQLNRSFNYLVFQMIENGDKNALFGSLMHVLLESLREDGNPTKLTEMVMKCMWKLTKKLNSSLSEVNVDQLLLDAHHFFVGYGKLTASSKPSDDKAYKTVKTMLFQLVTILGTKVMDHLVLIENASQTGVYKYLSKAISRKRESGELVSDVVTSGPVDAQQPKKVPQMVMVPVPSGAVTRLADALEKVAKKQHRRQAFRELYAITEQFPDFDLHAYVAANTQAHYQGYIRRGLKVVEYERECQAQNLGGRLCAYVCGHLRACEWS
jgi:cytoskeleton-associated protein 5